MALINADLRALLRLDYRSFWSQVYFDKSFHNFIDTFLRYFRREIDQEKTSELRQSNQIKAQLQREVFTRVFRVILRMSQHKESDNDFMSEEYFSEEFLHKQAIFDVPKIMDICVLYANYDSDRVAKIVKHVFGHQDSHFWKELYKTVPALVKVLDEILKRYTTIPNSPPASASASDDSDQEPKTKSPALIQAELAENSVYLRDILYTLYAFLSVYPPCSEAFISIGTDGNVDAKPEKGKSESTNSSTKLLEKIIALYGIVSQLYLSSTSSNSQSNSTNSNLYQQILHFSLNLFSAIFNYAFEQLRTNVSVTSNVTSNISKDFMNVFTKLFSVEPGLPSDKKSDEKPSSTGSEPIFSKIFFKDFNDRFDLVKNLVKHHAHLPAENSLVKVCAGLCDVPVPQQGNKERRREGEREGKGERERGEDKRRGNVTRWEVMKNYRKKNFAFFFLLQTQN